MRTLRHVLRVCTYTKIKIVNYSLIICYNGNDAAAARAQLKGLDTLSVY